MKKIKLLRGQNIWITSDTHYAHNNICRAISNWRNPDGSVSTHNTRDFKTLEFMNETIIKNINDNVDQNDILIHLGDWSFGGFENIKEFWDRINCDNIHLILGNHDHHIERNREGCQELFKSVHHLTNLEIVWDDYTSNPKSVNLVLCHYPIASWDGLHRGSIHLHGHCHLPNDRKFGVGKRMDVGMDGHPEFRPYNIIREIVPIMKKIEIQSEIESDHHLDKTIGKIG